jgi:hypothetical protein
MFLSVDQKLTFILFDTNFEKFATTDKTYPFISQLIDGLVGAGGFTADGDIVGKNAQLTRCTLIRNVREKEPGEDVPQRRTEHAALD